MIGRSGMAALAAMVMMTGLTGCAVSPEQRAAMEARQQRFEATRPRCSDDAACERAWAAARSWVTQNCGMKIQNITDGFIETYNSIDGNTALHCRVTKDPEGQTGWVLTVTTGCGNLFGCIPDAWAAAQGFNDYVNRVIPPRP